MKRIILVLLLIFMFSCTDKKVKTVKKNVKPVKICKNHSIPPLKIKISVKPPAPILDFKNYIPAYIERMNLNNRTLRRQRYKTAIYGGKKGIRARFHLAILLWKLAFNLEASLGNAPDSKNKTAILKYRKKLTKISNYRKESLFHLEYLVRGKTPSLPMLERFAYFTAQKDLAKSIPIFYRLFEKTKPKFRKYYSLDFASILIGKHRFKEAGTILSIGYPKKDRLRYIFLRLSTLLNVTLVNKLNKQNEFKKIFNLIPNNKIQQFIPLISKFLVLNSLIDKNNSIKNYVLKSAHFKLKVNRKRLDFEIHKFINKWKVNFDFLGATKTAISIKLYNEKNKWKLLGEKLVPVSRMLMLFGIKSPVLKLTIKRDGHVLIPANSPFSAFPIILKLISKIKIKTSNCFPDSYSYFLFFN